MSKKLISKVIFKYILYLIITLLIGLCVILSLHAFLGNLSHTSDEKLRNLHSKIDIGRHISKELVEIQADFLGLTAATFDPSTRTLRIRQLRQKIHQVEEHISIINFGGVLTKRIENSDAFLQISYTKSLGTHNTSELPPQLVDVIALIDSIVRFLAIRDAYIMNNDPKLKILVPQIQEFNTNTFMLFDSIQSKINSMISQSYSDIVALETQKEHDSFLYRIIELITILFLCGVIGFILKHIIAQITGLYKDLETNLYIDELTKLKSRYKLMQDLKDTQNPMLALIDIHSFRTINELYGVEIGNEVLIGFASFLNKFTEKSGCSVYRVSGDEFAFLKDRTENLTKQECIQFLDALFEATKGKHFIYVSSLNEMIHISFSIGISLEKENILGTADIALNLAKEQKKSYVFYSLDLNSIEKISLGVIWQEKLIYGIQTNAFLPFFQPIVDREQRIAKYEALIRFRNVDKIVSYVGPNEFLDIALKSHYYDEVSEMTLMKSLYVCASQKIDISMNLNYHDILNTTLLERIKKYILEKNIARNVVFEIVESQNIGNYDTLKAIMEDFRHCGVRFAIDDFGTGFSNFSHIFELNPDFIKIDGSLIKDINTNQKSYELIKSIVSLSKALNIATVAEYVHSSEVFETTWKLGIDYFQGYYFGQPRETI